MATMSFLFVDQVGSTAQLARLGDDGTRPVRQALFDLLTAEVERHGGEVVDNTGDGVMAVFPGAVSALDAAVGMQQAAAQHNRGAGDDRSLHLRVGVHTGEVTADEQGRWFGMPLVVAARLCALAATDAVWTSALVAALVGDRTGCSFEDLGLLELKGVGAPVPTVSVRWPTRKAEGHLPARMAMARRTPLAGRDEALALFRARWRSTGDGSRATVMVLGEPGVGKSRLAAEAAHEAALDGATVVEGGCDDQLPVPFRPFVFALSQLIEQQGVDAVERWIPPTSPLRRLLPGLGGDAPMPSTDPQSERLALFEELDALLAASGGGNGTFLLLEDLHWADEGTLQLLTHLARSDRPGRLLILGTYRESDLGPDHPLQTVLADMWRTEAAVRLPLEGLAVEAVAQQVAAITGGEPPPISFTRALTTATAGNPFFVEEVARQLVETTGAPRSEEVWSTLDVDALAVPDRVRDVVRQRAARLGDPVVEVLRLAAVVGREFSLDLLGRLDRSHDDDVLDLVERAATARLVQESPRDPDGYRFQHALIRQALYEELSPGRRVRLHRSVAEAMDDMGRTDPSALAHHWRLGAGPEGHRRAVEASQHAGAVALETLAFERAITEFGSAVEHLDRFAPHDDSWRSALLLGLGNSHAALAADREKRVKVYRAAAVSARQAGDPRNFALAALGLAGPPETMMQGDTFPIGELEAALDDLDPGDASLRVLLQASLGAALSSSSAPTIGEQALLDQRSDQLAAESIAAARATGDPEALAFALRARLRTLIDPLATRERLSMANEVIVLGTKRGDRVLEAAGQERRAGGLAELGDRSGFAEALDRAATLVGETREPFRSWMITVRYVTLALLDGDVDGAERRCDAYLDEFGSTAFASFVQALWGNQTFLIRFLQGRLDEVAWMLDLLPDGHTRETLRAVVVARIDPPRARRILDDLVHRIDEVIGQRLGRSVRLAMLGFAAYESNHHALAAPLRAVVAPYEDTVIMLPPCAGTLGHMSLIAGLLADLDGDNGEATRLIDRALAANLAAENRPMIALTRYHSGRLLAAHDPGAGASVMRKAQAEAAAMGMGGVVADCDRQLAGC